MARRDAEPPLLPASAAGATLSSDPNEPTMSIRPRRVLALCTLVFALPSAACGDSSGPPEATTYTLHLVDGELLPIAIASGGGEETLLVGEVLVLRDDGTGTRRTMLDRRPIGSGAAVVADEIEEVEVRHQRAAGVFTIAPPCPPDVLDCALPDMATTTGDGLEVFSLRFGVARTLDYRAIDPED